MSPGPGHDALDRAHPHRAAEPHPDQSHPDEPRRDGAIGPPTRNRVVRTGDDQDDGKDDPLKKRRRRRLIYTLIALAVLSPAVLFAIGWAFFRVPSPDDATNNQVATIAYSDGSPLASLVPAHGNRIKVGIGQIPLHVQQAVLSAEDRSFYSNYGFDPIGIVRAAWDQARGGTGGGSTITQQYVKNVLVGDEHSLWRKYREVVIATKVSQEQSKEEILENYLNTIYFGRGAYGIQAAAQAYFGKDVGTLTPSEGAVLGGLIQAPSKWDPAVNPTISQQRWTYVLDGMVAQHWLSPVDRARAVFPAVLPPSARRAGVPDNDRGHIVSAVRDELNSYGITEQQVNQEGLQVSTTIDPKSQQQAADAAAKQLDGQPANLRTALVSVDPKTGAVLAYYGGKDGSGFDYAGASRQPGSSFKPFVLLAGLERNPSPIGLGTRFDGSTPQTIAGTKVENSDGESCPNCDLKTAMTLSINTVYYQLGVQVGPQRVADAAHQAGVTATLPDPSGGISIGDKEVKPEDMASAYATFAGDGVYHRPHLVTRVTTADGRVLYDAGAPAGEQRISGQLARNVTESMLDVASHSQIPLSGRQVASKTGTVQSSVEGQNQDAWTVGYTPSVSTAVWVGTDDNSPIKTSNNHPIYGRGVPGLIWQQFMNNSLKNTTPEKFSNFTPIGSAPSGGPPSPTSSTPPNPDAANCADGSTTCPPSPSASSSPDESTTATSSDGDRSRSTDSGRNSGSDSGSGDFPFDSG